MRSPFRYPGGKTWLVPTIRQWLGSRADRVNEFIEPFAGGAIVALTVAFEDLAERVLFVELDEDVAAVWHTILSGDAEWLAERVSSFEVSPESVRDVLGAQHTSLRERAFATIVQNRISRGGILAPGAGVMKRGENGRGLASRWYPQTLRRRILDIARVRDRLSFIEGDGLGIIQENAHRPDAAFFIDPPYTVAGRRLYRHNDISHERLFDLAASLRGDFLMTYDDAPHIRRLAEERGFDVQRIHMKTTHHSRKVELLISPRLSMPLNPA